MSGSDPSVSLFEVYIGTHACYYFGAFIEWNVQRCTLEEVVWRDGTPAMLDFVLLDYWSNLRETKRVFPIPVPAGKEAEARRVIRTMDKVERPEQWLHQLDIAFAVIPAIVTLIFLLLRIAA